MLTKILTRFPRELTLSEIHGYERGVRYFNQFFLSWTVHVGQVFCGALLAVSGKVAAIHGLILAPVKELAVRSYAGTCSR